MASKSSSKAILDPAKLPESMTAKEKESMEELAYGTIILNLSDNIMRQVIDFKTAYEIWNKLDTIFLSKDLPNKAYLREIFFTYKMENSISLSEILNEFKTLSSNFKNPGEKIRDENEAFILLNSLLEAYKEDKVALKYGRESITTYGIVSTVKTKELELMETKRKNYSAEGHFAKGKYKNKWKE